MVLLTSRKEVLVLNAKTLYDNEIASWKYPKDASKIAHLSITWFQFWYLSQSPREMVYLGQFKEFQRFVFWHYTLPVRCLRFYFRIKNAIIRKGT